MSLMPYLEKWLTQLNCDRMTASAEGLTCCCPFHVDRKPSFTINGKTGLWICWSMNCPYGQGNLTQLLVYGFGMSMSKAMSIVDELPILIDVERIAALPAWNKRREKASYELMNEGLLGLYDKCPRYLLSRGFSKQILKDFEVGYDRATDYAVVPCRDIHGQLVGISKRACSGQEPKWLHELFSKGDHLYNAFRARWDRSGDTLVKARGIVVEGQLDCIWMAQNNWHNVVSTLSANVTSTQADLLCKCFSEVTIFFDSDTPGFVGAYYLAKKLFKRVPTYVVSYGELVLHTDDKLDPSRLQSPQIQECLDRREDALTFIEQSAAMVEWLNQQRKKKRLSNTLQQKR